MAEKERSGQVTAPRDSSAKLQNPNDITNEFEDFQASISSAFAAHLDNLFMGIGGLEQYAKAVSRCLRVPQEMAEAVMVAVASSSIGNKVKVMDGSFETNLSVWLCIVGASGTGKTPLLAEVMRPVKLRQEREYDAYSLAKSRYRAMPRRERESEDPPIFRKCFVSDTTPEALYNDLSTHPNGLLLCRDELRGWLKDFGRYGNSGEVQNLLSIHSGEPVSISRKTTDPIHVAKPFLAVVGGIQPRLLAKTFCVEDFVDSGFVGRFLFCWPYISINEEMSGDTIPQGVTGVWSSTIDAMYNLPVCTLTLSEQAKAVKAEFYRNTAKKMAKAEEAEDPFSSAMFGKFVSYADRLSGVLHCLSSHNLNPMPTIISADTYRRAVVAMARFESWGLKVRDAISPKPKQPTQKEVIKMLHAICPIVNQSDFARSIGKSQQYVNAILNEK